MVGNAKIVKDSSISLKRLGGDVMIEVVVEILLRVKDVIKVRRVDVNESERRNEIQHENNAAQKLIQQTRL